MLLRNATLADGRRVDVRIADGRIDAVGTDLTGAPPVDVSGLHLLPGAIDVHVHFRDPGFPQKETWATGSRSAAAGGVTTVVDQPNTDPPTVTGAAFDEKVERAAESIVDFGINGGVTPGWEPDTLFDRPLFALGEVFLADSTGDMGIDIELFETAVERATSAGTVVTVHAEDASLFDDSVRNRTDAAAWSAFRTPEAEVAAVERACRVGRRLGASLHIAHTSTVGGIDAAVEAGATCEVSPHHLLLSTDDLSDLGTFGRMNPPLRSEAERALIADRVRSGRVAVIATDHAPHTREEKQTDIWSAPSGVPGVETMLPVLLAEHDTGRLALPRIVELVATNPAHIFDLPRKGRIRPGADADLVLVDLDLTREIRGEELHSRCDWTPFEGWSGVPVLATVLRGRVIYRDRALADRVTDPDSVLVDGPTGPTDDARGRSVRRSSTT